MSKRAEGGFDIVAGLLIKLKAKKQVSPKEAEDATQMYNEMVSELNYYKNTYGSMQHQGQGQPKVQKISLNSLE